MDLSALKSIVIPEGTVIMIKDPRGIILWPPGSIQPTGGYVYTQDGSKVRIISVDSNYFTYSGSKITFK